MHELKFTRIFLEMQPNSAHQNCLKDRSDSENFMECPPCLWPDVLVTPHVAKVKSQRLLTPDISVLTLPWHPSMQPPSAHLLPGKDSTYSEVSGFVADYVLTPFHTPMRTLFLCGSVRQHSGPAWASLLPD